MKPTCHHCESNNRELNDIGNLVTCKDCGSITWMAIDNVFAPVLFHDNNAGSMLPENTGVCVKCGRKNNVQINDETWHCGPCQTRKFLDRKERNDRLNKKVSK